MCFGQTRLPQGGPGCRLATLNSKAAQPRIGDLVDAFRNAFSKAVPPPSLSPEGSRPPREEVPPTRSTVGGGRCCGLGARGFLLPPVVALMAAPGEHLAVRLGIATRSGVVASPSSDQGSGRGSRVLRQGVWGRLRIHHRPAHSTPTTAPATPGQAWCWPEWMPAGRPRQASPVCEVDPTAAIGAKTGFDSRKTKRAMPPRVAASVRRSPGDGGALMAGVPPSLPYPCQALPRERQSRPQPCRYSLSPR